MFYEKKCRCSFKFQIIEHSKVFYYNLHWLIRTLMLTYSKSKHLVAIFAGTVIALLFSSCKKEEEIYDVLNLRINDRVLSQNRSTCTKIIRPDKISYSIISWSIVSSEGCKFDEFPDIRNNGFELSFLDAPLHYWHVEQGSSTGQNYSSVDGIMTIGSINNDYLECTFDYTMVNNNPDLADTLYITGYFKMTVNEMWINN